MLVPVACLLSPLSRLCTAVPSCKQLNRNQSLWSEVTTIADCRCCCHAGILLFAAVSPLAALLTYLLLTFISSTTSQGSSIPLAVLFSGGTVLYAATMHILPSALGSHQHQHECDTLRSDSDRRSRTQQMLVHTNKKAKQLLYVSVGMLVPLMLSAVVHHEH